MFLLEHIIRTNIITYVYGIVYKHRINSGNTLQAGSSMSGSGVSKYGWVLSSSGTSGNTSVGCREPRNLRHLMKERKISAITLGRGEMRLVL